MYTKTQIKIGIESALFDPERSRNHINPVDGILSEIERLASSCDAYIQPLSVFIKDAIVKDNQLKLTIDINAAVVRSSINSGEIVKRSKNEPGYFFTGLLDGEYEIRTTNTNIDRYCYLVPETAQCSINSDKITVEVTSCGDASKYLHCNTPRIDLIMLSILDGRLVIKAK